MSCSVQVLSCTQKRRPPFTEHILLRCRCPSLEMHRSRHNRGADHEPTNFGNRTESTLTGSEHHANATVTGSEHGRGTTDCAALGGRCRCRWLVTVTVTVPVPVPVPVTVTVSVKRLCTGAGHASRDQPRDKLRRYRDHSGAAQVGSGRPSRDSRANCADRITAPIQ